MFAAVAIITAVSCNKEIVNENDFVSDAKAYTAVFGGDETKAVLSEGTKTLWENGDEIILYDGTGNARYTTALEAPAPKATFTIVENNTPLAADKVLAVYPAWADGYQASASDISAKTVSSVYLDPNQNAIAGSYDPRAAIAMAYSEDGNLMFKNATALLKFKIKTEGVRSVTVYTQGENAAAIADMGSLSYNDGSPSAAPAEGSTHNWVELSAAEGTLEVGTEYYISIFPQVAAEGFAVEFAFEGVDGKYEVKSYDSSIEFKRNTILNLGELEFTGDLPEPDEPSGFGLHIINETGWENIAVYAWYEGLPNAFGDWPGTMLTETVTVGGVDYLYLPIMKSALGTNANLIFHNNAGIQLADYPVVLDKDIFVRVTASGVFDPAEEVPDVTWYLVGDFNTWTVADENYKMVPEGEYHVFKNFVLENDAQVKFNAGSWGVNRGGSVFAANAPLDVAHDAANLKVPAGTYDVYLSLDETQAYFMTDGKTPDEAGEVTVEPYDISKIVCGLAGSFGGENLWNNPPVGNCLAAFVSAEGNVATYKLSNFALTAGDEMKLILDGVWCGGTLNPDYTVDVVFNGGNNIVIPEGIAGNFDIYVNFKYELVESVHTFTEITVSVAPAA